MSGTTVLPSFAPLGAGDVASLVFQNAGSGTLAAGVATFGQLFTQGELAAGQRLMAEINGALVAVQVDVKTTWPDGSAKMAVLSVVRPDLAAGTSMDVVLTTTGTVGPAQPTLDLATALNGHSFLVDVTPVGGSTIHIDVLDALRDALAAGTASIWQQGPLASQARVEIEIPGTSQRMVFDVTAYQGGGFSVDAMFNNDRAMETTGGLAQYSVAVTMDGRLVASESVSQYQYQNWHREFSLDGEDGGQGSRSTTGGWLNIQHNPAELHNAGAIADYNLTLGVSNTLLTSYAQAMAADSWGDPLSNNGVTMYMPMTGGRADIGFITQANTSWLLTQDARAAAYAMGQAEAASAVPWHFWDGANNTWLNTDNYPVLWADYRPAPGTPGDPNSAGLTQKAVDIYNSNIGWAPDTAHQPDLSFIPYLLTGERWMLDNLQAQASYSIMVAWPADIARNGDNDNMVAENQVRGAAWALRQIEEAAWASPAGSAEQAYFRQAADENWAWLVSKIPEWTALQGEVHGYLPTGVSGVGLSPWQQDFFASTAIAAARHGNADALTFLQWQSNFLIGRFTHEDSGFEMRDGAAYHIIVGNQATNTLYKTWAEIGAATTAAGLSNGDTSWAVSQGYYPALALASLAGIYELTGNVAARDAYYALLAEMPPYTGIGDFQRDPTFSIAPPDDANVAPPPPTPPPPPPRGDPGIDGNDAPVAQANKQLVVAEDSGSTSLSITAPTDADGDVLKITITTIPDASIGGVYLPGGTTALKVGDVLTASAMATLVFRPAENASGPAGSFSYSVSDGSLSDSQTITLSVTEVVDTIVGGLGADSLKGTAADDILQGMDGADSLSGNGGNDTLDGGLGNDTLDGGAGADSMAGGAGNDSYIVDNAGDVIVEAANAGTDTVRTNLSSYGLGANVENLVFTGTGGFAGTGNGLANQITGGAGADTLNGGGGADTLTGGGGDDLYIVNSTGARILEGSGGGTDTIQTTLLKYTLPTGVENLIFTGTSGNFTGTGNAQANLIVGGTGNDILNGGGGADILTGGAGLDRFVFSSLPQGRITDFAVGTGERIDLSPIDATPNMKRNQSFDFIGAEEFHRVGGELRATTSGGETYIQGDRNGDGVADFTLTLTGSMILQASDFFL